MARPFPAILDGAHPRDAIDLMVWPCFALAKGSRHSPIFHEYRGDFMRVTAVPGGPGIATIWDADILIWAVSQLAEGRDQQIEVSPILSTSAYQVLRFLGKGTRSSSYRQLDAALDRLAGTQVETSVCASIASPSRFHWVERWERGDGELTVVIADWLFAAIVARRRVLRIDPAYRRLTGGIERWLWRLLRRHAHGKSTGWEIPLRALQARSGSLARPTDFIGDLRTIARENVLPGYTLSLVRRGDGERLRAAPSAGRIHSPGMPPVDMAGFSSTEPELPL